MLKEAGLEGWVLSHRDRKEGSFQSQWDSRSIKCQMFEQIILLQTHLGKCGDVWGQRLLTKGGPGGRSWWSWPCYPWLSRPDLTWGRVPAWCTHTPPSRKRERSQVGGRSWEVKNGKDGTFLWRYWIAQKNQNYEYKIKTWRIIFRMSKGSWKTYFLIDQY